MPWLSSLAKKKKIQFYTINDIKKNGIKTEDITMQSKTILYRELKCKEC